VPRQLHHAAPQQEKRAVPMTIENQIIDFLYSRRGQMFCRRCLRRVAVLPDLPEIDATLTAIGRAVRFRSGDAECSECRRPQEAIGAA
jgi:hypothetical protein